jgi:hypothetical protein
LPLENFGLTFDDTSLLYGFTPEKVEIYWKSKSSIDTNIFDDWFKDITAECFEFVKTVSVTIREDSGLSARLTGSSQFGVYSVSPNSKA